MKWSSAKPVIWALVTCMAVVTVAAQGGRATRPQVTRPDGPVWQVIRKNCTMCHGIDDYAFYALDKPGWQSLLETKHKSGAAALSTVLSEADKNILLDWLSTKFGANTKPFPRTYVPPEITTYFSDPEARRLLENSCTSCHEIERVDQARYPEDKWRVIAVDMRERGAKLSDEDLEKLVEWLGRVRGTNQDK